MFDKIENLIMKLRHAWQRAYRGYDDTAYWGLDSYITEIALPVLKWYKENKKGIPGSFLNFDLENDGAEEGEKLWLIELDKMIDAFQLLHDFEYMEGEFEEYDFDKDRNAAKWKRKEEGLQSFAKHFMSLWD